MKKIISVLLGALLIISLVCACSASKDEDINYVIKFSCEDESFEWNYEMESEGVVTVMPSVSDENGSRTYIFLLESVGEGETVIKFILSDKLTEAISETVSYRVSVDSQFVITAQKLSDDKSGEAQSETVSVKTESDAEMLIEKKLLGEDEGNEGKLVYETHKDNKGNFVVRVFKAETDSDGKTVMKYQFTYIVSPDGEMTKNKEDNISDMIVASK